MPLKQYGVLKARPIEMSLSPNAAHLQIHLKGDGQDYRIALNVRSQAIPAELRYIIHKDFVHPFANNLVELVSSMSTT